MWQPPALPLPVQMLLLGTRYVGIATTIHTSNVVLASRLRPWLVEGQRHALTRRLLPVALALVALWLAWSTRR